MRLICPSCASQYEVDAAAVGARGRMVRCANCGAEWFQSPSLEAEPAPPPPTAPPPAPTPQRAEPAISAPEPEPAPAPQVETRADIATYTPPPAPAMRREEITFDPEPEPTPQFDAAAAVEETRVRRRVEDEREDLAQSLAELDEDQPVNSGGAFLAGFSTVAVLAVILIGVYIKAPDIVKVAPGAESALSSFTGFIDQGRLALAALTQ